MACGALAAGAGTRLTAQNTDPFCATTPTDLLASLEGSWTLTQGPGVAAGGTVLGAQGLVLPPQPPVRLSLEFLPELGIGFLIGQGQEMMMIPARAEYIAAEVGFLSSPEIAEIAADAPDCDWSKLPVIVGTNIYELKQASNESQFKKNFSKVDLDPSTMILVCDGFFDSLPPGVVEWIDIQDPPPGAGPALAFCPGQPSKAAKGEMSMTLFLRFSDTDSGSGELIFEGNLNSAHFAARAPITLSR